MLSSYCPKCKKFLTPDLQQCPSCGFNRKKFYQQNFYVPAKERDKLNQQNPLKGLFWVHKIRIFLFPPIFLWYLLFIDLNKREFYQALIIAIIGFVFDFLLLFYFWDQITLLYEQQQQYAFVLLSHMLGL